MGVCGQSEIYFNNITWRYYLVSSEKLKNLLKDDQIIKTEDGFILK